MTTETFGAFGVTTLAGELAESTRRLVQRWWLIGLLGLVTAVLGLLLLVNLATAVGALAVLVSIALIFEGVDDIVMADRHRTRWPWYLLGVLWIVLGVIALAWPGITLLALAVLIGIGFVVAGGWQVTAALSWRRGLPMWGLWLLLGVLTIVVGVVSLAWPGITVLTLAIWLGITLVVRGIGEIWFSLQLRRVGKRGAIAR